MALAALPGVTLYYETRGPQQVGPAVLFLHGLASSSADWSAQLPVFERRHRVLAVDLRAHGRSSRPPGRLTVEAMADDVEALLAGLDETAVHVIGLSLGACVALRLALQSPARVRSLTLVNAFARLRPAGPGGAARLLTRLGLLAVAPMDAVARHVARGLFPRPEQRELYAAAVRSLSAMPRGAYVASIRALAAFDARGQLAAIRCPTLVIAGDRDGTVPLAAKAALADRIRRATLLVVPDSGHATPHDQPEVFSRAVLEFLSRH